MVRRRLVTVQDLTILMMHMFILVNKIVVVNHVTNGKMTMHKGTPQHIRTQRIRTHSV